MGEAARTRPVGTNSLDMFMRALEVMGRRPREQSFRAPSIPFTQRRGPSHHAEVAAVTPTG